MRVIHIEDPLAHNLLEDHVEYEGLGEVLEVGREHVLHVGRVRDHDDLRALRPDGQRLRERWAVPERHFQPPLSAHPVRVGLHVEDRADQRQAWDAGDPVEHASLALALVDEEREAAAHGAQRRPQHAAQLPWWSQPGGEGERRQRHEGEHEDVGHQVMGHDAPKTTRGGLRKEEGQLPGLVY
jgi:hypothetical protein